MEVSSSQVDINRQAAIAQQTQHCRFLLFPTLGLQSRCTIEDKQAAKDMQLDPEVRAVGGCLDVLYSFLTVSIVLVLFGLSSQSNSRIP